MLHTFLDFIAKITKDTGEIISKRWKNLVSISTSALIAQIALSALILFLIIVGVISFVLLKPSFNSFLFFIGVFIFAILLFAIGILSMIISVIFKFMFLKANDADKNEFNFSYISTWFNELLHPSIQIFIGGVALFFANCGIAILLSIPFLLLAFIFVQNIFALVLVVIITAIIFIITSLITHFFTQFFPFYILYEGRNVFPAIVKSYELVRHHILRVFGANVIFAVLVSIIVLVISIPFTIVGFLFAIGLFVIGIVLLPILNLPSSLGSILLRVVQQMMSFFTSFIISWFVRTPLDIFVSYYLWQAIKGKHE